MDTSWSQFGCLVGEIWTITAVKDNIRFLLQSPLHGPSHMWYFCISQQLHANLYSNRSDPWSWVYGEHIHVQLSCRNIFIWMTLCRTTLLTYSPRTWPAPWPPSWSSHGGTPGRPTTQCEVSNPKYFPLPSNWHGDGWPPPMGREWTGWLKLGSHTNDGKITQKSNFQTSVRVLQVTTFPNVLDPILIIFDSLQNCPG